MQQFARKMWGETGWGMPTSLALHLALALLLLVRLPELSAPAKEQSVSVELVPTPKNEKKPEQKPTKQKSDEARNQRARAQPQSFESAAAPTEKEKPPEPDLPPAAPKKTETPSVRPEASRPAPAKPENAAKERPAENRTALAELRVDSTGAANKAADAAAAPPAAPIPQEKPVFEEARAEPTQNPAEASAERESSQLVQAKELYSKNALSDPHVKQAIGSLPPKKRIVQLCTIEALEQIRHQRPGAIPDMFGRPDGGFASETALKADGAVFRSQGKWYSFDFTCEVNPEATSVTSFSFAIGKAIPKSEWGARQLPSN
ncbi:DUF930 domain-containing protein [Sinorhizobium medicae]|uniref:Peptidase n=2 Tax=Sinorhizobium medicae TaxID=110321 RepID=A0ABX4TQ87_9HYPH|nr:DUF930 domain-containing protein [Sinorhizobium medicae]MDX0452211.1 DUF930 domain-containing protein [Sinorhizobium medicae]MDX0514862.1 DUF930 domain-containing protein [Sinorhizobium medicae]MDX0692644.1 DUF930 domain-containing protein [Sinorhizobium medicae]MDX0724914.1 DUF930 domain-containing protein [Sinorhizobium medicae]MDX0731914.1 DUF930 domain-containing protein [Sinorhizobium medicae]